MERGNKKNKSPKKESLKECNIMLDIETADTKVSALMLSIAAVVFDPKTGKHSKKHFYRKVDIDSYPKNTFTISGETLSWWMNQSDDARKEAFCGKDRFAIKQVMEEFKSFCLESSKGTILKIWSHGATFDIPIVTNIFNVLGMDTPWLYPNARDTRTFYEMTGVDMKTIGSVPIDGKILPAHHPLADCARQIEGIRIGLAKWT